MPRAEITTTDCDGHIVTRTVEDARYDDDGLLYIVDQGREEIIRMTSPQFCSVKFIHETRSPATVCVVDIIQRRMQR
jgi:hypothetical protein